MATPIKFIKASEIPATWLADALYFIKNNGYAETYVTGSDGTPEEVGNTIMIEEIAGAMPSVKFGVEDTTSDVNRSMDMQLHDLHISNGADVFIGSTGSNNVFHGIHITPGFVDLYADQGISPDNISTRLKLTPAAATIIKTGQNESPIATMGDVDKKQDLIIYVPENLANKNVANGYAGLDQNVKIPSLLLPAYVDDVLEFNTYAELPQPGEKGKIYLVLQPKTVQYRWADTTYAIIDPAPGTTDNLPEGAVNLYYTPQRVHDVIDTWGGTNNISAVGTITQGTWHGTPIEDLYITSAPVWNAKEKALTFSTGLSRVGDIITADLATGKPGGGSVTGGTAASNGLTLSSTADAVKGNILFGNSRYEEANNRLLIGDTAGVASVFTFEVIGAAPDIGNTRYSNDASAGTIRNRKARGTTALPLIIADGDTLGSFSFSAYDGAVFRQPAAIRGIINGTPASNQVPTDIVILTGTSGSIEAMRVTSGRNIGIGTGATISAKLHIVHTAEQIRVGYDASNYLSATVNSTGNATFNLTGTTPKFTFSQGLILSTLSGSGTRMLVTDNAGNVLSQIIPSAGTAPVSASVAGSDVITTNATATDITGLNTPVGTNKKYRVIGAFNIGCNNTGGVRFAIVGPAGSAILSGQYVGNATTVSAVAITKVAAMGALSSSANAFNRVNIPTGMVSFIAYITTGVTAGNVQLQFASATAGETSTVFIGSTIDVTEVT